MAKIKTEAELNTLAKEAFEFHENADVLHQTSDGQCFLDQAKSSANMHARHNDLKVKVINRAEIMGSKNESKADSTETGSGGDGNGKNEPDTTGEGSNKKGDDSGNDANKGANSNAKNAAKDKAKSGK